MDSLDFSDIVGIGLGKTSGDDDGGIRIGPDGLSDGLSRLHRGFVGDRARIDDTGTGSSHHRAPCFYRASETPNASIPGRWTLIQTG